MPNRIYLIDDDKEKLTPMEEQKYEAESLLQKLLVDYPELLAGEQMNEQSPRRWLLVKKEMRVPDEEDGAGRWSLDHLFLDQDGIPTLVEVKRSSDTRLRREVVGQMLDYAANAVVYWPIDRIKEEFATNCAEKNQDPTTTLINFLLSHGPEEENGEQSNRNRVDEFWEKVKINLESRVVRMVFVADVIPDELKRIIEFLNAEMEHAEVLGVEIKQFANQKIKTMVPRVIGQSAAAEYRKGVRPPVENMTEDEFFQALQTDAPKGVEFARWLIKEAKMLDLMITPCPGGLKLQYPEYGITLGRMLAEGWLDEFQWVKYHRINKNLGIKPGYMKRMADLVPGAVADEGQSDGEFQKKQGVYFQGQKGLPFEHLMNNTDGLAKVLASEVSQLKIAIDQKNQER